MRILKYLILIFLLMITVNVYSNTIEQPKKLSRSFSFDSGYIPSLMTNRAVLSFGMEYLELYSYVLNEISETSFVKNYPMFIIFPLIFDSLLSMPYNLAMHEYGHFNRAKAYGYRSAMYFDYDGKSENKRKPYYNFWTYFFTGFYKSYLGGGFVSSSYSNYLDIPNVHKNSPNSIIIITAGGVNNQMHYSEIIEDQIYLNQGYGLYFLNYIYSKASTVLYIISFKFNNYRTSGDIQNIKKKYKEKGYGITQNDMILGSVLSLFCSATTYALASGYYRFAQLHNEEIKSFELWHFRIPDLNFYMTPWGLSYKIKSAYRFEEWNLIIPFAFESVVKGRIKMELTLGVIKKWSLLFLSGNLLFNFYSRCIGFDSSVGVQFLERFSISLGIVHYNSRTLFGVRNIPTYEKGTSSEELWGKMSYHY